MTKKESKKRMAMEMGYAASLGIAMVVAIFGSLAIGVYLDRKFGTKYICTVIFLVIGVVAGFRNFWLFIKKYLPNEEDKSGKGAKDE